MKLRQLRYFVKVIETGNITRAAEQLNLAQTALGIQIRNLEESLRVPLLERHSRGVRPTRAGTLLYERSIEILQRIDETRHDILSLDEERIPLRLGASPSILKLLGTDIFIAAREELPDIALHVVEELSFVLADALHRGELDYILAYDIGEHPALRRKALMEEDLLYISAPADKPQGDEITFREAMRSDLALASDRDVIWQLVHDAARRLSIDVSVTYQVQSQQGMRTLIKHGVAQSIMPYGTVAEELRSGELVARRIVRPRVHRTLFLASLAKRRQLPDENLFLGFIGRMVDRLTAALGPFASPLDRLGND